MNNMLSKQLKRGIKKYLPKESNVIIAIDDYMINGIPQGCKGYIVNESNGICIYVDTTCQVNSNLTRMMRYTDINNVYEHSKMNRYFFSDEEFYQNIAVGVYSSYEAQF